MVDAGDPSGPCALDFARRRGASGAKLLRCFLLSLGPCEARASRRLSLSAPRLRVNFNHRRGKSCERPLAAASRVQTACWPREYRASTGSARTGMGHFQLSLPRHASAGWHLRRRRPWPATQRRSDGRHPKSDFAASPCRAYERGRRGMDMLRRPIMTWSAAGKAAPYSMECGSRWLAGGRGGRAMS